jgi:hypothetical protein
MIHWIWALIALFAGFTGGLITIGLLTAGVTEEAYRNGYLEGQEEGYQAGLEERI